jgi:acetyl esterase/lipase
MSNRVLWLAGAGAACGMGLLVWTFSEARSPSPTAVRQESDVVFAHANGVTLKLDVAMPHEGDGPFPAVVCIHGGGWVGGDRKQMAKTIEVLAGRGYVAVAPDYRLAPTHRFPACVEDCKTAVRWLRANCGRYRVDTARVGALGLSAGGHLACMLGVTAAADGLDGTGDYLSQPSRVQAVVSFSGPTDLTDETLYASRDVLEGNLMPLFGGTPRERRDAYRKASPAHYRPRTPPPFFLVHGEADKAVPVQQARALAEQLKRCGGKAEVLVLPGEGHTWSGTALIKSIDKMLTFLDENLLK